MHSNQATPSKPYLLTMSFVEGAAVMGIELAAAKIIAPFYGNTLYVWAAILGITLFGLLCGYLLGGRISAGSHSQSILFLVFLISAILVGIMPYSSSFMLETSLSWEPRLGISISTMSYLFPPLLCFGMVTPIIIRLLSDNSDAYGRTAGTVYAISTTGGIMITFLYGFFFLPFVGLKISAGIIAVALLIFPLHYYIASLSKARNN